MPSPRLEYRDDEAANAYKVCLIRADLAKEIAQETALGQYSGRITEEIIAAAEAAATAWAQVTARLKVGAGGISCMARQTGLSDH